MVRSVFLLSAAMLGLAAPAAAADQVKFGGPAAWVDPLPLPTSQPKDASAPVELLLSDSQVRIEPRQTSIYSESAVRIQQPAGLHAGALVLQWAPATDEITVHKFAIRRAGREIDVLASGQKFEILRREQNLDQAVLDGSLTAVLQPEGLQVGDTVHVTTTTVRRDPVLGRHAELISGLLPGASPQRGRLRIEWPAAVPLRFRPYHLEAPKLAQAGGMKSAVWSLDDTPSLVPPSRAPGRFQWGRQVEVTDYASWAELGAALAPLYEKASVIPPAGPLRAELEKIRKGPADPVVQANAALRLVQDQVRYVALQMGSGGLVPAGAEETWSRRFGDCKAKTALLIGLLRELGIAAVPVAVNAQNGDGIDQRLPLIALFDHVLVRATIGGRDYWLDGTRNNDPRLPLIDTPAFGWGVPLTAGAQLVRIMPGPAQRPTEESVIHMDARKGGSVPAPTTMEVIFRGDYAIAMNTLLTSVPADARNEALKEFWKDRLSHVEVKTTATSFNRDEGEYRLSMTGDATLKLDKGAYWVDVPTPGYKPDFERQPGPDQKAPFAQSFPSFTRHKQTILVPDDMRGALHDDEPIDRTVAGVRYQRRTVKDGNTFVIETSAQALGPELEYASARAAEKELRALDKMDFYIVLAKPTSGDIDELLKEEADSVAEMIGRGAQLAWVGRFKESVAEYDKALAREPRNASALEGRGFSRAQMGDLKLAREDYAAAAKLGSKLPFMHVLNANEAIERKDWPTALAESGKAIALAPQSPEAWMARAEVNNRAGNEEATVADASAAIRLDPNLAPAYLLRINANRSRGATDKVLADAEALLGLELTDPYGYVVAGKTYAAYGRRDRAMAAFDRALAVKPESYVYLNRAGVRPRKDIAGRRADLDAALKMDSESADVFHALAALEEDAGNRTAALNYYDKSVRAAPDEPWYRIGRGILHSRLGNQARAEADFAVVTAEAEKNAATLNQMCWEKATANVALESALADCDRAIKLQPDSRAYLDSRGLVLLRLGRLDEALAVYDAALAKSGSASSHFGRALVLARKGDRARSAAAVKAAETMRADVREEFEGYGLNL